MDMQATIKNVNILSVFAAIGYLIIAVFTINNCYFWDVIQQVSKEAHYFYQTNFETLIIPANNSLGIESTGYHPPFMALITAVLWKILGYELWVSHALSVLCAIILFYNLSKLLSMLLPAKYCGFALLVLLLDPTVLSQFAIASPDFILLCSFIVAIRGILKQQNVLVAIGVFFMCAVNIRGIFAACMMFVAHIYYISQKNSISYLESLKSTILPYIPVLITMLTYYIYYFYTHGWFFTNSQYSTHYMLPENFLIIIKQLAVFVWRSLENGHFAIWGIACYFAILIIRRKDKLSIEEKFLLLMVVLLNTLYIIFCFITRMPQGPRYYMPQFLCLSILSFMMMPKYLSFRKAQWISSFIIIITLSGNFWVCLYPEKLSKPWDSTLAHLPYYELRKDCFEYIDNNKIDYNDIGAGFCLYSNRKYIELIDENKIINNDLNKKYFIYSNISNLSSEDIDYLQNPNMWQCMQIFESFPVHISIYKNLNKE